MLELEPKTDRIQATLAYAKQNLKSALSVEEPTAGHSTRQSSLAPTGLWCHKRWIRAATTAVRNC